ncbi:MAG TPA: hypothetical protein VKH81_15790 [Candidatus Angelobacter sp.]|nr:hypothetical protein [Candidatus Angelobacter sp.]
MSSVKEGTMSGQNDKSSWITAVRARLNAMPVWGDWLLFFVLVVISRIGIGLIWKRSLLTVDDITVFALTAAVFSWFQWLKKVDDRK